MAITLRFIPNGVSKHSEDWVLANATRVPELLPSFYVVRRRPSLMVIEIKMPAS